jgi:hypothetical protein
MNVVFRLYVTREVVAMTDSLKQQQQKKKRSSAKNGGPRARRAAARDGGATRKSKTTPVRQTYFAFFYSLESICPQTGAADT